MLGADRKQPETILFQALAGDKPSLPKIDLLSALENAGLRRSDTRIRSVIELINEIPGDDLSLDGFSKVISPAHSIIERSLSGDFVVPDFNNFRKRLESSFERIRSLEHGHLGTYVPELAKVDPNKWAFSACTIDGQRIDLGDSTTEFCLQSTCKPFSYCMALEAHGEDFVHQYVGREPSGRQFNELALNHQAKPHNPMVNAGAIMISSLLVAERDADSAYRNFRANWRDFVGQDVIINQAMYQSEKDTADQNYALAHFMKQNKSFPDGVDIHQALDLYFMCCSTEVSTSALSVFAATLANGGTHPESGKKLLNERTVRDCLSLMSTCGMYDFSGEFAFSIGLPAKSGVSGAVVAVVPNVLGFACWSPRLDDFGISTRGLAMCREIVSTYNFHAYDPHFGNSDRVDPKKSDFDRDNDEVGPILWAASKGDLSGLRRLYAKHKRLDQSDYDQRTALHLAAAEGHLQIAKYLIQIGLDVSPRDRWGGTPLDDAIRHKHIEIEKFLRVYGAESGDSKK